jgi:hypothetical protein
MRGRSAVLAVCLLGILGAAPLGAEVPDTSVIPAELEPWKPWVLFGHEERFCPSRFDRGDIVHCRWPSRLKLELSPSGGRFTQEWTVTVQSWVELPGGPAQWPHDVKVGGQTLPVVRRKDVPAVFLKPGKHVITGAFTWPELPETLPVPPSSGLLSLSVDGKVLDTPRMTQDGRLWLQKRDAGPAEADRVEARAFRLLDDSVPMQVTTLLKVTISGRPRELRINGALLDGAIPMHIESPIPARLEPDGALLLQGRPGRFDVKVLSRFPGPVERIGPAAAPFGPEIWAFQARTPLRLVQVEGVSAIDPRQTESPAEWASFSTYIVQPGSVVTFKEMRRGDPDPAPDRLNLQRTWWLDFDGKGFTIRDQIQGTLSRQWTLAMNPPVQLGRVSVDGADQLITEQGPERKAGVELRRGELHLVAESRYEAGPGTLPAVSWDHDFQSLGGVLNLPPGWRLFSASGVDVVPGTWFERWTLLDLFLALIASLAVARLWGWRYGLLALATLGLVYHEQDAPRQVWLHLLGAVALLRVLPEGRLHRWVNLYRWGAVVVLLVLTVPFMVQQVRWGIYPQLEPVYEMPSPRVGAMLGMLPSAPPPEDGASMEVYEQKAMPGALLSRQHDARTRPKADSEAVSQQSWLLQDPKAVIQTGPGLPRWSWRQVPLRWNGPVSKEQEVKLRLLSPAMNLVLAFVRVLLLAALVALLIDWKTAGRRWLKSGGTAAASLALLAWALGGAASTAMADYPPPQLLDELRQRLLKPPECLPHCAEIPLMELHTEGETFRITLTVDAAEDTAVPLPATAGSWMPSSVSWNDRPAEGLLRDSQGQLWIRALRGSHRVILSGGAPAEPTVQIPLPLRPHRVIVSGSDWEVRGVQPDGRPDASLQLSRKLKEGAPETEVSEKRLPPFLNVERVISLGLSWQVTTRVTRVTPPGSPVTAMVPLLDGESVTTPGIRVENRRAVVSLEPQATEVQWTSALAEASEIRLAAPQSLEGPSWVETWILDASPIWHCDLSGIPVIHHQDGSGIWKPQWRPWPGESVTISVSRPAAMDGQRITVDQVGIEVTPGERFRNVKLTLNIRASEGARFPVMLPPESTLEQVRIDGKLQPIRQQDRGVTIPLEPGSRSVLLEWREAGAMSSLLEVGEVRIGSDTQAAVNGDVTVNMPHNRWILWAGGPRLGPAVLFWSSLVVVILAALGLGRISWTPLGTHHWLLLGLGLTQVHPLVALVVVGWILAMGVRARKTVTDGWLTFDAVQLLLVLWTVAGLVCLYAAVHNGLLGIPHMQIAGNHSTDFHLRWTQDRFAGLLPRPWVLSVPLLVYRVLMLLWALWLALSVLGWLKWAYQSWSHGETWRKIPWPRLQRRGSAG